MARMTEPLNDGANRPSKTGILSALPEELGPWGAGASIERQGLTFHQSMAGNETVLACAGGVGKVRAARAATLLVELGVRRLLVVGTCGGLRKHLGPGVLVHCTRAAQTDYGLREGREIDPDPGLLEAWQKLVPGRAGWFLTADRAVMSTWRKIRLARAFSGDCVAEMETAAAALVAQEAGIPWAALRAVTDRAGHMTPASFRQNFPIQAGRAADTVSDLLEGLPGPVRG
jgi:adenosylhomocysteine nucleosidase